MCSVFLQRPSQKASLDVVKSPSLSSMSHINTLCGSMLNRKYRGAASQSVGAALRGPDDYAVNIATNINTDDLIIIAVVTGKKLPEGMCGNRGGNEKGARVSALEELQGLADAEA
jgi:hypothetical protein